MPHAHPPDPTSTSVARAAVHTRLSDLADVGLNVALAPWRLVRILLSTAAPRLRILALLALVLACALAVWLMSPSGILAAALAIAFKWDLLRGLVYAAGMFLSPALRAAVGAAAFVTLSAIFLHAIRRASVDQTQERVSPR
ncbi:MULTISPECIES: hypothetical protein [unclassified Variovorax]|uniref:hypothetical protein n=1 Tax=unclassified Variovorax TaxID=663243 RepID=UPI000837AA39|nr:MULTISPECIES: hypothetical protein [unclassified Variovorax]PNG50337.1 hypothetical protein CHC06_05960 [Variovorax sp. B2]PNG51210.1 hypothetical protein CHC07_05866 [Variovorax sp. B4]VTV17433.1 hypothetical protein WDL1P1_00387 [Variovorax sp. WDL1]